MLLIAFLPALAVAGLALNVGSKIAGALSGKRLAAANKKAALEAFDISSDQIDTRERQEETAARAQLRQIEEQFASVQGSQQAVAADSGLTGQSLKALLNDTERDALAAEDSVRQNLEFTQEALGGERRAAAARANARIAGVQAPDFFNSALQIAGAGVNFLTDLELRKPIRDS